MRELSLGVAFLAPVLLLSAASLDEWKQVRVVTVGIDLHHVQGIDIEGNTFWISSVDRVGKKGWLTKLERSSGRVLAQVEVQDGKRFHPGGIALDGNSLWVPVAEYDQDGPTTVQRRDKTTLALQASFEVQDHIGCIAAGSAFLVGGSWGSRTIYSWRKDGQELSRKANPHRTAWQDLKMSGDLLMASGILSPEKTGAVEWLKFPSLELVRRLDTGRTDRGVPFGNEGMAWQNGRLFLLPEDNPTRLFEFSEK